MESEVFVDLFDRLKGTPQIIEQILNCLSHKDLRKVQCVCKSWNAAVNEGNAWRNKLNQQLHCKMWKQVFVQLPMNEIVEGSRNSARDTFTQILHSVQVLKKRWKNGTSKQRRIQNVPELASSIPSLLTMNEKWIAMGCSSGEILVFDRKTLAQLNQPDLCHGQQLPLCVKFTDKYLVTVSSMEIKVWSQDSWNLLETLGGIYSQQSVGHHVFAFGEGLFVHCNNLLSPVQLLPTESFKLSVWRLLLTPCPTSDTVLKLVHNETFITPHFHVTNTHVSKRNIITLLARVGILHNFDGNEHNLIVEVRDKSTFDVLYTANLSGFKRFISFVEENVIFQTVELLESPMLGCHGSKISVVDCHLKIIKKANLYPGTNFAGRTRGHCFLHSNSCFGIGWMKESTFDIFSFESLLVQQPLKTNPMLPPTHFVFQAAPLQTVKPVPLTFLPDHNGLPKIDFIMDELSIVQYCPGRNWQGRNILSKLLIIDYLK